MSHQMTVAAMAIVAMKVDVAVIAGCDPAPVFEATEHAFDDIALLVDGMIAVELDFAVALGRDDGLGSARSEPVAQLAAVIAPFGEAQDRIVSDQLGGGRHGGDTLLGNPHIVGISGG